jgi:hypothetical protein
LFDGENISFNASPVMYINSTNIPPIMNINRICGNQNLLSFELVSFLVGLRTYQHPFSIVPTWKNPGFGYRRGREFFWSPKIHIGSGAVSVSIGYRVGVMWEVLLHGLCAGIVHSRPSGAEICIRVYSVHMGSVTFHGITSQKILNVS